MKKIIVLMLAACMLAMFLTACGEKQEPVETTTEEVTTKAPLIVSLVGTWAHGSYAYTFNADGTGDYGEDRPFTYTDDGKTVTIHFEGTTSDNVFGYRIEGATLYIEDSLGNEVTYEKK